MSPQTGAAGKVGKEHTADLAARLKGRADARAARSVEDPLTPLTAADAAVSPAEVASHALERPAVAASDGRGVPGPASPAPDRPIVALGASEVLASAKALSGPEGRLENSGEPIRKLTLELPLPLVDALAQWELAEARRTGRRVYRERLIDTALAAIPNDFDDLLAQTRALPEWLRTADSEQVGTRLRESVHARLKLLRPELRARRVRGVYLRDVYAAAIYRYMLALGAIGEPSTEHANT